MATSDSFVRRSRPNMYQFLIDEYSDHVAKAIQARKAGLTLECLAEKEKAQTALHDFLLLMQELPPYLHLDLWPI